MRRTPWFQAPPVRRPLPPTHPGSSRRNGNRKNHWLWLALQVGRYCLLARRSRASGGSESQAKVTAAINPTSIAYARHRSDEPDNLRHGHANGQNTAAEGRLFIHLSYWISLLRIDEFTGWLSATRQLFSRSSQHRSNPNSTIGSIRRIPLPGVTDRRLGSVWDRNWNTMSLSSASPRRF